MPDKSITSPDGVRVSVGVGLTDGKPAINLHVSEGETEIFCFLSPKQAWMLAADLIGKSISLQMPLRVVRAFKAIRGKTP